MTRTCNRWGAACRALALGIALAPSAALAAPDAGKGEPGKAREILDALRALQASVEKESLSAESIAPAGASALAGRPARSITPPTIDAARVDELVDKLLDASKAPVNPMTTDEEFIRRVSLDVTGRLPNPAQIEAFGRETAPDKRSRLIDDLLKSPDYARNWAHYWRDVIQYHSNNPNFNQIRYEVLTDWLTDRLAANTPWDEVATALITGTGNNDAVGPVNFALAEMAQPVELAGEVSRIFMGVQIQCAQCHDHPTDPWKREQFHEFAAFFAGVRPRQVKQAVAGVSLPVFAVENQQGRPRYTMPDLKDPQKLIPISPRFTLAGESKPVPAGLTVAQRRALAASYVTGQDNPWFARAFVNRVWYALIGYGFYNPVDDLGPGRSQNAPEVLDALASDWQKGGYDVHWLFRTILNTRAYQRESRATMTGLGQASFASNCPIRLRSDQLLDALVQVLDLRFEPAAGAMGQAKGGVKQAAATPFRRRFNPRVLFNLLFGVDPSTPNEEVLGTIPQALFLMNSPQVNRAIKADKGTMLGAILDENTGDPEALEDLYLRVLARRPNPQEVEVCTRYIARVADRREAFEDILWNLINTTEFVNRR